MSTKTTPVKSKTRNVKATGITPEGACANQVNSTIRTKIAQACETATLAAIGKDARLVRLAPVFTDSRKSGSSVTGLDPDGLEQTVQLPAIKSRTLRNDDDKFIGSFEFDIARLLSAENPGERAIVLSLQSTCMSTNGLQKAIDSTNRDDFPNIEAYEFEIARKVNNGRSHCNGKVRKDGVSTGVLPLYSAVGLEVGPALKKGNTTYNANVTLSDAARKRHAKQIKTINALCANHTAVELPDRPKAEPTTKQIYITVSVEEHARIMAQFDSVSAMQAAATEILQDADFLATPEVKEVTAA
jgi:hypothetical protein